MTRPPTTRFPPTRLIALAGALLMTCATLTLPADSLATKPIPPSVYTGTFVGATPYAATFHGAVNPHGLATVYAFQFGTTTGYGAQTALASAGNGTTEVRVSQSISGLQPGITYHMRIVATNSAGTTYGQDVAFATKKIPLTLKLIAAPNPVVYGSSFTVSGVLSGTESTQRQLVLQANPFPYRGPFRELSHPVTTSASGSFSFPVANLLQTSQLRVVGLGAQLNNPTIVEQVAVRVHLHAGSAGKPGFTNMYGTVEPSEVGASVSFQLLRRGSAPLNVGWTKAERKSRGVSRFSHKVRLRGRGLYRAEVHVFNGAQVSGYSRSISVG